MPWVVGELTGKLKTTTWKQDKTMYKVTTDQLADYKKGEKVKPVDVEAKGIFVFPHDVRGIHREIVDRNPDWFQPVEEIKEGEWVKNGHGKTMFRYHPGDITKRKGFDYDGEWSECIGHAHDDNLTKATDDEIEQALGKEAKRRGYPESKWESAVHEGSTHEGIVGELRYIAYKDGLTDDKGWLYWNGRWAQIIDNTPDIEINGYTAEFHEDYVQFGCEKVSKSTILEVQKLHDSFHIMVMDEKGDKLTDQIKQIAQHYE